MKSRCVLMAAFIQASVLFYLTGFSQADSIFNAHSEAWKVQPRKGLSGLSKPAFGPYVTLSVKRFDSINTKRKSKEGTSVDVEISSESSDFNHRKDLTIERTKCHKLTLVSGEDTIVSIFCNSSISKERRQTVLGMIISKDDEGQDLILSYNRDIAGKILIGDTVAWEFFIDDFTSSGTRGEEDSYVPPSMSGGYLKTKSDSLSIEFSGSFDVDIRLFDKPGACLAALNFTQKPLYVWMRDDIDDAKRHAIASFFAVILAFKDY